MFSDRLSEIKEKVSELALKIQAPSDFLPTFGSAKDWYSAHPYIEMDELGFIHYVVFERGEENLRRTTSLIDELLYWVFADVTFTMACEFELRNRTADKDSRRTMFEKQEELLGILSASWREKQQEEHRHILRHSPFDDFAVSRASYSAELRREGYDEAEIQKLALAKYPRI